MIKNKIITLTTIAVLTLGFTVPTINVLATDSIQNVDYDTKNLEKTVGEIQVTFKDTLGNTLGTINKTNILKGKKYDLVETNTSKNWKIIGDLPSGVVDKDNIVYEYTLQSNKQHEYLVYYSTPEGIVQIDKYTLEHGAVVTFDFPDETEDYIKTSEGNIHHIVDTEDNSNIIWVNYDTKHFETDENGEQVPVYKDFNIDKVDYSILNYAFTYNEDNTILDITPENYNYNYTDVLDTINNSDLYPRVEKIDINYQDFGIYFGYDPFNYDTSPEKWKSFDSVFGQATGLDPNKKLVDLNEILKQNNINPDTYLTEANIINLSIGGDKDNAIVGGNLSDATYGMLAIRASLPENIYEYLDYEVDTLISDINITYDLPLNINNFDPEFKDYVDYKVLKDYPRFFEVLKSKIVNKRIGIMSSSNYNTILSGFADIYAKDGELRIKVYQFADTIGTNPEGVNGASGLFVFNLDSKITVNYVSDNGDLLGTYTRTYDKNSKITLENKAFDGYELLDKNDKNKEIVADKDLSIDIVYKKVKEIVVPEEKPEVPEEIIPEAVIPEEVVPEEVTPEVEEIVEESVEEQDTLHKTGQLNEGIRLPDLSMFYILVTLLVMSYFLFLV